MSLDGASAEVHDFFRQRQGCFHETLQALEVARQAGLPFQINTTVTRHNRPDLIAIGELAASLGAMAWDVFMFIPTGRGRKELALSAEEYEEVMVSVHEASKSSAIPIKMTCSPQYRRLLYQREGSKVAKAYPTRGCMCGDGFCFVSHVGEVLGCGYLPLSAGNIRNQGFQEIYQSSPFFQLLRDLSSLKGKCGLCEFKALCGGCRARALAMTGDPLGEEPFCTYQPKRGKEASDAGSS